MHNISEMAKDGILLCYQVVRHRIQLFSEDEEPHISKYKK